jgi:hypothetical protein
VGEGALLAERAGASLLEVAALDSLVLVGVGLRRVAAVAALVLGAWSRVGVAHGSSVASLHGHVLLRHELVGELLG